MPFSGNKHQSDTTLATPSATPTIFQQAQAWLLYACVLSLPFSISLNSLIIMLWLILWVVEWNWKEKLQRLYTNLTHWMIFFGFYGLHVLGMFYSDNLAEAGFDLERKMTFVVLPLLIGSLQSLNLSMVRRIQIVSTLACLLILLAHNYALVFEFDNQISNVHFRNLLTHTPIFAIHHVYLSLYILLSIIFVFEEVGILLLENKKIVIITITVGILFFYLLSLFILSARTVLLSTPIILGLYLLLKLPKKQAFAFISILSMMLLGVFFLQRERIQYMWQFSQPQEIKYESPHWYDWTSGLAIRQAIWSCSMDAYKGANLYFGHGTGDAKGALLSAYTSRNFVLALEYQFNAHNQYIETLLALGFVGLIYLIGMFFSFMYIAYLRSNWVLGLFMLSFMISCTTESMLQAQKGIVFFTLVGALLLYSPPKPTPPTNL
jgi:O-antigen ligase